MFYKSAFSAYILMVFLIFSAASFGSCGAERFCKSAESYCGAVERVFNRGNSGLEADIYDKNNRFKNDYNADIYDKNNRLKNDCSADIYDKNKRLENDCNADIYDKNKRLESDCKADIYDKNNRLESDCSADIYDKNNRLESDCSADIYDKNKRLESDCDAEIFRKDYSDVDCAAECFYASRRYPALDVMRVDYFDESGALILKAEYPRNYRGINYRDALKIMNALEKRGYDRTDAADEIFRGFKNDLEKLRAAYCYPSKNARAFFYPDAEPKFRYEEGEDGAVLDADGIAAALIKGMPENKANITVRILKSPPEISAEKLKELTARRAAFSTGYANSCPERKRNIALAARLISGTVIPPDGIFSFNGVVGERSAERGFQTAPIIFDGRLVDGVGGGVCQVSTTVYNAALYAGLEIVHAKSHSSAVGYVKPSFDAMVSEYNDLKIKNNTGSALYTAANADGNRLKIEFFGKPIEKGLKISLRSEIKKVIAYEDKIIQNDGSYEIPEEGFFRISRGANGYVSEGYADYYRGGALERSERIRSDTYRPMNGVIVKNTESIPF